MAEQGRRKADWRWCRDWAEMEEREQWEEEEEEDSWPEGVELLLLLLEVG